MHKIELIDDGAFPDTARSMKVGQVGITAPEASYQGTIMRTYDGWVFLDTPNTTWSERAPPDFRVRIIPRGSVIKLTLGV